MLQGSGFLIFNCFRQKIKFGSLQFHFWKIFGHEMIKASCAGKCTKESVAIPTHSPPHSHPIFLADILRHQQCPLRATDGDTDAIKAEKLPCCPVLENLKLCLNICLCDWSWLTLVTMQLQIEWNKCKWSWVTLVTSIMSSSWRRWYCMILYAPWYCIALHDIA